jgi:uncharacterized membrane protein YcaP (DUF421 family)
MSPLEMSLRALSLFAITLVLLRLAGMRTFGARTPFDTTVAIMLGAILSRAVVGASPYLATVAAAVALVVVHRLVAMLTAAYEPAARLLNGSPRLVYRRGQHDRAAMWRSGVSRRDLECAARKQVQQGNLDGVDEIWLEEDGEISVVVDRRRGAA